MSIRGVIFDCFGVLYRDNLSLLYDIVSSENQSSLQDIIRATDHGFLTRQEYYTQIAELANVTVEDVQAIERRQHSRDQAMVDYTQTLKPAYKIGLLSNIDSDTIRRLFPEVEMTRLFDAFVVSGDVGVTKPSPQIFEMMAERLGCLPEECLMIDDIQSNVDGARLAGMRAIQFISRPQLTRDIKNLLT